MARTWGPPAGALDVVANADGTLTVRLVGDIDQGNAADLGRRLKKLVDEGHRRLRLNLGGVIAVDAAGLAALARLHVDLVERGGILTLADVPPGVRREIATSGRVMLFQLEG